jgi:hypothetical protein
LKGTNQTALTQINNYSTGRFITLDSTKHHTKTKKENYRLCVLVQGAIGSLVLPDLLPTYNVKAMEQPSVF